METSNPKDGQVALHKLSLNGRLKFLGIRYWTLVLLLVCTDLLGPFATDAHLPSLPQMAEELNCSPRWVQSTVLSYSLLLAFCQLLGGLLSDLYGRRVTTIIGLGLFVLGNFGCVFCPNVVWLNVSRIVQGIGAGMSTILSQVVARDIFEEDQRLKVIGVLGAIHPIAIAGAPMFGGYIGEKWGWRMVFMCTSVFAALTLIWAIVKLPETRNLFVSPDTLPIELSVSDKQTFNTKISSGTIIPLSPEPMKTGPPRASHLPNIASSPQSLGERIPLLEAENDDPSTMRGRCHQSWVIMRYGWQLAFSDRVFFLLCLVLACRMTGVFIFLNEFSFVFEQNYGFTDTYDGLTLGSVAIFLTIGSSLAIALSDDEKKPPNAEEQNALESDGDRVETSHRTKCCRFNKLQTLRISASLGLVAGFCMLILPLILYKSDRLVHSHSGFVFKAYDNIEWYVTLVALYIYVGADGIFNPPAMTIGLEPYQHVAGTMASITGFFRIFVPSVAVFIITQLTPSAVGSTVIHIGVGLSAVITSVIIFCIRRSMIDARVTKKNAVATEPKVGKKRESYKSISAEIDIVNTDESPTDTSVNGANGDSQ